MKNLFIAALFLLCLPIAHPQMFWSQNYAPASSTKAQVYTESFAYTTGTDLVTDAPAKWKYNTSGMGFQVKNNALYSWIASPDGSSTYPGVARYIGVGTINVNQYATATYNTVGSVNLGPAVRISGKSWYDAYCQATNSTCGIDKFVNGVATPNIATCSKTAHAGDIVEIDASGSNPTVLTLYYNGAVCTTYTDSSSPLTSGTTGISNSYGSSNSGDTSLGNVIGGNL